MPNHLIDRGPATLEANPTNSVIAFKDNSSTIRATRSGPDLPREAGEPSPFGPRRSTTTSSSPPRPTTSPRGWPPSPAPRPAPEAGSGTPTPPDGEAWWWRAPRPIASATCRIPGYPLPWEDPEFRYPSNLASPLEIEIEASNGASDYGNKFGEPVIQGYTRSFGLRLPNGERREWIKPIMFSGGIGQMDARHPGKGRARGGDAGGEAGGPAYRIGMGGGAASSMVQGENVEELDFNAVQRGDAEMEQKVNRVIRACVEMGDGNPIVSIHDQGAGGNCNVLKELVEPPGPDRGPRHPGRRRHALRRWRSGAPSTRRQDALLLRPGHADLFQALCDREKVPAAFVGTITGDGRIVLHDDEDGSTPVNMELDHVLGAMPQKTFELSGSRPGPSPSSLPADLTVRDALDRVLRLLSVGSKRFLTNKVDRCVTGLVARQQCAGPLQLTVADVAVIAQSHFGDDRRRHGHRGAAHQGTAGPGLHGPHDGG